MATAAVERPRPLPVPKKLPLLKKTPLTRSGASLANKSDDNEKLVLLHAPNSTNSSNSTRTRSPTTQKVTPDGRIATLAKPKPNKASADTGIPSKVKPSALLYEITERTNQLAQPRSRGNPEVVQKVNGFRIAEATGRVLELSKPKTLPEEPRKPPGYVAPSALTAIATQRILELSRPRKPSRPPSPKKRKKRVYEPCSPRLTYLSYPRQATMLEKKLKSFLTSTDDKIDLKELEELGTWCARTSEVLSTRRQAPRQSIGKQLKSRGSRRLKRRRIRKKPRDPLPATSSNRTIISIDLNSKNDHRPKKGKKNRRSKRRKLHKSRSERKHEREVF